MSDIDVNITSSVIEVDVGQLTPLDIDITSGEVIEIDVNPPAVVEVDIEPASIVELDIEPSPVVQVEVFPGGILTRNDLSLEYQLVLGRLLNQPSLYKEFSYTGDNLTAINIWANSSKTTQLMTIAFEYTGDNLSQKILTDLIGGDVLTVNYSYTGDNLTSIDEVFS